MKVLAFAASSSKQSINQQLVRYAAELAQSADDSVDTEILDINDFEMPIYSSDRENESGIPDQAQKFFEKISQADKLIISLAEHNGSYTAAYKNLFDWTSRIDMKVYQDKPSVLLATSPGPGGAQNVLNSAEVSAPHFAMDLKGKLSVPSFYDNFDSDTQRINNPEIDDALQGLIGALMQ